MKKFLLILLLVIGPVLAGCSRNSGLVESSDERNQRLAAVSDIHERQLVDDWDEFWLYDENLHLSDWHVFLGE